VKFLTAFLLLSFSILGQDTTSHKASIMLNGSFSDINGQSQIAANVNNSYTITRKHVENLTLLKYLYVLENGTVIINDLTLRVQPRYLKKNWSVFAYHQFSSILSRKIDARYEFALGGGRYLIKKKDFYSTLSYATIYVNTRYKSNLDIASLRHSGRVQVGGNIGRITYALEAFYQPTFQDFDNYNYMYDLKVSVPIVKRLSFNVNSYGNYESFNLKGVSNSNDILSLGFIYNY
jgi:hypothetical protein